MKSLRIPAALFFFLTLISFSAAQTVDEVIDNYVNAVGGIEKLNSVKTLKITGKFLSGSFEIPFTQTISVPDKILIEMTMQGLTMKQACDGTTAWMINPFQGSKEPEKMTEEQTKYMKEQADFEGKLINYKDKGCTAELMGKEDMEGSDVYKIKLTDKDGDITYYYIDASNNILLKESAKRKIKEKEIDQDIYYSDYKPIDGIMIPMALEIKSSAGRGGSQKVSIDSVEFNVSVDDSIFKMPEEKQ
jgi:outer membrane lipoprotein-sorting protein